MSLTTVLKNPIYRKMFMDRFPKPKCDFSDEILANPQTKNYTLIGTAFDYILRFHIEKTNPNVKTKSWIAEQALTILQLNSGDYIYNYQDGKMTIIKNDSMVPDHESSEFYRKIYQECKPKYDQVKIDYEMYLTNGIMTCDLLKGTIFLAQLDSIYRSGRTDVFTPITEQDADDLENLLNVAKNVDFFSTSLECLLNPTFGEASKLVGGADADLVIGDTLIDIKTTKNPKQQFLDAWLQIVGYYILNMINNNECNIKNIGIYFSRHGVLKIFPVDVLGDVGTFVEQFKELLSKNED